METGGAHDDANHNKLVVKGSGTKQARCNEHVQSDQDEQSKKRRYKVRRKCFNQDELYAASNFIKLHQGMQSRSKF